MDETADPDDGTIQRRRDNAAISFGCLGEALGYVILPGFVLVLLLPAALMHWM